MRKKGKTSNSVPDCVTDQIGYVDVKKVHPSLRIYLGYCLHKASTIFRSQINQAFMKHKIQGHHVAILSVISSSDQINQMKIGEEMGIDKATMVKITDHLEKLKLIERIASTEDRRVKNLVITNKGRKTLKDLNAKRGEIEKQFFSGLTDSETETFKSLLLKILSHQ
jgi:DNA-binding MarR family transcriptional regulator